MSKGMTPDQLKTLEQLRQRLSQLSTSVQTLHAELERAQTVPSWPSLQSSAQLLSYNLQQLGDILATHQLFLRTAHAYPLPSFPGHTHPFILETLLSKKLAPRADEWIDDFTTKYDGSAGIEGVESTEGGLRSDELLELWNWAGPAESTVVREMLEDGDFEDDFTLAERESGVDEVVTGLKRKLDTGTDDEDGEDGKGEGDAMQVDQPPGKDPVLADIDTSRPALPLDNVLRFLTTGDIHSHITPYRG